MAKHNLTSCSCAGPVRTLLFCQAWGQKQLGLRSSSVSFSGATTLFSLFFPCSLIFRPFPIVEYSKWRVLGARGEMQAVLGISIKCRVGERAYWCYSSFICSSQLCNEENRGAMNKAMCSSHPETQVLTGWNWFLSYSTPGSQHWSEPSIQDPYSEGHMKTWGKGRAELPVGGRGDGRKHRQQTK